MATDPRRAQAPDVSGPAPSDGREALQVILDQAAPGEGIRHLWIGRSRSGKSHANAELVKRLPSELVVCHDPKDLRPHYEGAVFQTADEARGAADRLSSHVVVIRRDTAENAAALVRELGEKGISAALVLDEASRAATVNGGDWLYTVQGDGTKYSNVRWTLTDGGALGISHVALLQSAARSPSEALNEAQTVGIFRQRARAANYVAKILELEEDAERAMRALGRYEFILLVDGDWDGKRYRFSA